VDKEAGCEAITLHNLAALLIAEGRTSDAEAPSKRAVLLLDRVTSSDDPARARLLQTLWYVYAELGDVGRARQICQSLSSLHFESETERALFLSTAATQSELERRDSEIEGNYLAAIEAWERLGSDGPVHISALLGRLALFYQRQGRPIDAQKSINRALSAVNSAPSALPSEVIGVRHDQAVLYGLQSRWDLARDELQKTIEFSELHQVSGSLLKGLLTNYAYTLQKTHQKQMARAIAARAAAIPSTTSMWSVDISALRKR
jgi:tetratricopeptide (TPR) repeat protein